MHLNRRKGFGLIEIMVVISIVSILSSVGVVATQQMRSNSRKAKVQVEVKSAKNALDIYQTSTGGYPNPDPGEKKLYCIGSTQCVFHNRAITERLDVDELPEYDSLGSFQNENGLDRGYLYLSCGDVAGYCNPDDTAIIYAADDAEWIDFFDSDSAIFAGDNYDWSQWDIDWSDYDEYVGDNGGNNGNGTAFLCDPGDFPNGSFEVFGPLSTNQPILSSSYCSWNNIMGQYQCDPNSCEGSFAEFTGQVQGMYPYSYCGQPAGSQFDPNCVDWLGTTYCKIDC